MLACQARGKKTAKSQYPILPRPRGPVRAAGASEGLRLADALDLGLADEVVGPRGDQHVEHRWGRSPGYGDGGVV